MAFDQHREGLAYLRQALQSWAAWQARVSENGVHVVPCAAEPRRLASGPQKCAYAKSYSRLIIRLDPPQSKSEGSHFGALEMLPEALQEDGTSLGYIWLEASKCADRAAALRLPLAARIASGAVHSCVPLTLQSAQPLQDL